MRGKWLFPVLVLTGALLGGVAHAGSDPATTEGTLPPPSTTGPGDLSLVLSIRALALGQAPLAAGGDGERVKAPTGAGTSRWPTAEVGRGVYISVMPACIPGVDEPLRPASRAGPARRR
jgi:hypothetical protein